MTYADEDIYTDDFLCNVKSQLREEISKSPDQYDASMFDRWIRDEVLFLRYVRRQKGNFDATVAFLLSILHWRQANGISSLSDSSFPREFYEIGGMHTYGWDKAGNCVCYIRARFFTMQREIVEVMKKFVIYQMYKADELGASNGAGWVLVFDCTGAVYSNIDREMAQFLQVTLRDYFPSGQAYMLAHNLPWLLNAVSKLLFTMLPHNVRERLKHSNDKTITQYIDRQFLPPYLGGTCDQRYPDPLPANVLPLFAVAALNNIHLTDEQRMHLDKYYEKISIEIQKERVKSK